MKVFDKPCFGCPFTKDSIVSPARVQHIRSDCIARDAHFECHKMQTDPEATQGAQPLICAGYYQSIYLKTGDGQLTRIAERFGALEVIPIPPESDARSREQLTPYHKQWAPKRPKKARGRK